MEKTELLITHHGRTLHGYFFKPKATRKFPLVIMSHGYNGYKRMILKKKRSISC